MTDTKKYTPQEVFEVQGYIILLAGQKQNIGGVIYGFNTSDGWMDTCVTIVGESSYQEFMKQIADFNLISPSYADATFHYYKVIAE